MARRYRLERLTVSNLLSFGETGIDLELRPLNVLIGPNGAGKSNLLSVMALLKALPANVRDAFAGEGSSSDWRPKVSSPGMGRITTTVGDERREAFRTSYSLGIEFPEVGPAITSEVAERVGKANSEPPVFARTDGGAEIQIGRGAHTRRVTVDLADARQSCLVALHLPGVEGSVDQLVATFSSISLYRALRIDRLSPARQMQPADTFGDHLNEDGTNLPIVLSHILAQPGQRAAMVKHLRRIQPTVSDISVRVFGGMVQAFILEDGLTDPVPATRWAGGLLRYIYLLTILLHPDPPSIVCIEEPEDGLHHDAVMHLADLLVEASERMQLIVTTHSPEIVAKLTDTPEAVVVVERNGEGTTLRRLDRERLSGWLVDRDLADLWVMGELGGNP